jgi:hypothetical protein
MTYYTNLRYDLYNKRGKAIDLKNAFFEFANTSNNNLKLINVFNYLDVSTSIGESIKSKPNVYHFNQLEAIEKSFIVLKKGGFNSYKTVSGLIAKISKDIKK